MAVDELFSAKNARNALEKKIICSISHKCEATTTTTLLTLTSYFPTKTTQEMIYCSEFNNLT